MHCIYCWPTKKLNAFSKWAMYIRVRVIKKWCLHNLSLSFQKGDYRIWGAAKCNSGNTHAVEILYCILMWWNRKGNVLPNQLILSVGTRNSANTVPPVTESTAELIYLLFLLEWLYKTLAELNRLITSLRRTYPGIRLLTLKSDVGYCENREQENQCIQTKNQLLQCPTAFWQVCCLDLILCYIALS